MFSFRERSALLEAVLLDLGLFQKGAFKYLLHQKIKRKHSKHSLATVTTGYLEPERTQLYFLFTILTSTPYKQMFYAAITRLLKETAHSQFLSSSSVSEILKCDILSCLAALWDGRCINAALHNKLWSKWWKPQQSSILPDERETAQLSSHPQVRAAARTCYFNKRLPGLPILFSRSLFFYNFPFRPPWTVCAQQKKVCVWL